MSAENEKFVYPKDVSAFGFDWGRLALTVAPEVNGAERFSGGVVDVKPGQGHARHNHPGAEEIIFVISGTGEQMVEDENGNELAIVRGNLPFAVPSRGEYGTYFIGYARDPAVTELMLTNMFIGRPPGNYDRLLDFSTAVTGTLFFVPPQPMLEALADGNPAAAAAPAGEAGQAQAPAAGGALDIGSLKGQPQMIGAQGRADAGHDPLPLAA